jgi:hypothetical protein
MRKVSLGLALLALIAVFAVTASVQAKGAQKTTGTFAQVPGHADYGITGTAKMIRNKGKTIVQVHLEGLDAGETYPTHVHNAPCSSGGGGHYQDQVGGLAAPPNELWPSSGGNEAGITATASGNGNGHGKAEWVARPEAQSIVVHLYSDTAVRVACAQLS